MKFILASGNVHKKKEYEELLYPNEVDIVPGFNADEIGNTYKENATIKLKTLISMLKQKNEYENLPVDTVLFADDSGLEIENHKEILGLYTSRFMEEKHATQCEKNDAIISLMQNETNRNARFVCHISFLKVNSGNIQDVEGEIKGNIAKKPDGNGGFGYDPIFIPLGEKQTLSSLGEKYKSKFSHRANACSYMIEFLKK